MRIRTIKPEFWVSESVGRLSRDARLLFIGLWSFADDSGRGRGALPAISGALFPYDRDALERLPAWLDELDREGMIRRYKGPDGNSYFEIPKWLKHQKIEKPSRSKFPPFDEYSPNTHRILPDYSALEQGTGNREQVPMEQGPKGASESPWNVAFGLELPAALQTQPCLEAVKLWLRYKAERKESYKRIGLQAALTKWANEFSPDEFPSVIDQSMAAGWKGLFKIKADLYGNHAGNGAKRPHRNDNMCVSPGLEEDLRSGEYLVFGEPSPLEKQKSQTG